MTRDTVYTPFLRRFTDEPARELSETVALYHEVRNAHRASVWASDDVIERVNNHCAEIVGKLVSLPNSIAVGKAFDRCQSALIGRESTIISFPEIDWGRARLSMKEQVDLRRFLRAKQHFLGNQDRVFELLVTALCNVIGGLAKELPSLPEDEDSFALSVPLVTLLRDVGGVADKIIGTICDQKLAEAGLFIEVQEQLYKNICRASGVDPDDEKPR